MPKTLGQSVMPILSSIPTDIADGGAVYGAIEDSGLAVRGSIVAAPRGETPSTQKSLGSYLTGSERASPIVVIVILLSACILPTRAYKGHRLAVKGGRNIRRSGGG